MSSKKAILTSFFDGLTTAGLFGDLRIPGVPDRMFKEEEPEHAQSTEEGGDVDSLGSSFPDKLD